MKKLNSFSDNFSINFFNVKINLPNGCFMTNMHIKPIDCHQYLHNSYSHPKHTKTSSVYGLSLRAIRFYSLESDFLKYCSKIKSWFLKRGCAGNIINKKMKKVKFSEKVENLRLLKEFRFWLFTIFL